MPTEINAGIDLKIESPLCDLCDLCGLCGEFLDQKNQPQTTAWTQEVEQRREQLPRVREGRPHLPV
jgi:hypothetical protein